MKKLTLLFGLNVIGYLIYKIAKTTGDNQHVNWGFE